MRSIDAMFIKLTPTPYQERTLGTDKGLWINANDIIAMAEYNNHTAIHTKSSVYGVLESPQEILDTILDWSDEDGN